MNSLEFGVPQDRDRIFMMGVLKGNELARKVISVNDTLAFPWNSDLPYDSALVKKMNCLSNMDDFQSIFAIIKW